MFSSFFIALFANKMKQDGQDAHIYDGNTAHSISEPTVDFTKQHYASVHYSKTRNPARSK